MATVLNDLTNNAIWGMSCPPQILTEAQAGSAIDLIEGDGPCFVLFQLGEASGDTTVSLTLEQSANGSTWTTINDVDILDAESETFESVRFVRTERYVRCQLDVSGSSPEAVVSVLIGQQRKLF